VLRATWAVAAATAVALAVSACGTREPHSSVTNAAGSAPASSSPAPPPSAHRTRSAAHKPGSARTSAPSTAHPTVPVSVGSPVVAGPGNGGVGTDVVPAVCNGSAHGTIKLGSVNTYSGTAGTTMVPGRDVLTVWAAYVNAHGGICGRHVTVLERDDRGSPQQAGAAVRDLVSKQHVAALLDMSTAATLSGYQQFVESNHIPVIGGDLLTGVWNRSHYFFPQGASETEALYALYRSAQHLRNGKKVAYFYCAEIPACQDSYTFQLSKRIPDAVGSKIVYSKQVSGSQLDFTDECRSAQSFGAGAVFAAGDATFAQRIADSCAALGLKFGYLVDGVAAIPTMAHDAPLNNAAFTVTQVAPWPAAGSPGQNLYALLTGKYNVARTDVSALYLAGALLAQQALTAIGTGTVSPASVLASLRANVKGFTAGGLTGPLSFGAAAQPQTSCVGTVAVSGGVWRAQGGLGCRGGTPGPIPTP
jgi:ABC-type branched-subunit amino acid transport system substrate-binding protein